VEQNVWWQVVANDTGESKICWQMEHVRARQREAVIFGRCARGFEKWPASVFWKHTHGRL
jgi:hypothetical protein